MSSTGYNRTLYEDWKARRDRQAAVVDQTDYDRVHLQLLDYLLERYAGAPQAERAVRPLPVQTSEVNERAIIVHHHIDDRGAGVANATQARTRVSSLLQRLRADMTEAAAGEDESDEPFAGTEHQVSGKLWDRIVRSIRRGGKPDWLMKRALRQSPFLPASALKHLYQRVARHDQPDLTAVALLVQAHNRSVYDFVARAWRDRLVAQQRDDVFQRLQQFFCDPDRREAKRRRIRLELADDRGIVRSQALQILRQIGTLEDISLLSDLLALPAQPDEYDNERQELLAAARNISQISSD